MLDFLTSQETLLYYSTGFIVACLWWQSMGDKDQRGLGLAMFPLLFIGLFLLVMVAWPLVVGYYALKLLISVI